MEMGAREGSLSGLNARSSSLICGKTPHRPSHSACPGDISLDEPIPSLRVASVGHGFVFLNNEN